MTSTLAIYIRAIGSIFVTLVMYIGTTPEATVVWLLMYAAALDNWHCEERNVPTLTEEDK